MKTFRLIATLLIMVAASTILSAKEPVDAKRAQIPIPEYYKIGTKMSPEEYWEMRDQYYKRKGLDKIFKRDFLDKIDFIEFKLFEALLFKDGYRPYDENRIYDIKNEVFDMVNKGAKGNPRIHIPNEIPGDTINVTYVVEIDGSVGPIYMTKGHKQNQDAIAKALREYRFSSPAEFQNKPVRSTHRFTIVTNRSH